MRHRRTIAVAVLVAMSLAAAPAPSPTPMAGRDGVIRGRLGAIATDAAHLGTDAAAIAVAESALARHADVLGVDPAGFEFFDVRRSVVGVHVRGREVRGGVPVDGTSVAVHIVDGETWTVEARPSRLAGQPAAEPVSERAATTTALELVSLPAGAGEAVDVRIDTSRVLVEHDGRLADTWRVRVAAPGHGIADTIDVDARTGLVRSLRDRRLLADGTATLFDPNPVVTARDKTLRQPEPVGARDVVTYGLDIDMSNDHIDDQLRELPILDYDEAQAQAGRLLGPWVDVRTGVPLTGPDFQVTKTHPGFEGLMAYAHIDRFQRYLQGLGFTGEAGVNAEPQIVYAVRTEGHDNSHSVSSSDSTYDPYIEAIVFGTGGVDDAEDAETILHEYGHSLQHHQVPGWGEDLEGGAMGEGFGDFLAASYFAAFSSGGFQDLCYSDWNATWDSDGDPPCTRRLDSSGTYPADVTGLVHDDGMLWSAYLWRVRGRLANDDEAGGDRAAVERLRTERSLRLVIASHEFLSTTATFQDAVNALLQARDALGMPASVDDVIADEAHWSGFLA